MAKVPNTNSFSLQDVVNVITGAAHDLADCFAHADANLFDPAYEGARDRLSNFRNYGSGYNDIFLPSLDELNQMRLQLHAYGVGSFSDNPYWSSTEINASTAYGVRFAENDSQSFAKGASDLHTRACRSFTGSSGDYAIRDTGPAGGYIFAYEGGKYYEAAPLDQSVTQPWSNITNAAITGTGTAIGTGKANSDLIVAQAGHTNSAAKLCLDLVTT